MQPAIPRSRATMIKRTVVAAILRCVLGPSIMFVLDFLSYADLDYPGTDLMSSILEELFNM